MCQALAMTPGEIVTTVLSSLAFVMSVVSLGWQVARARANRPRLHVEGSVGCTVMEDDYSKATWSFDITVANLGSEAITVDDARWIIYSTDGGIRVKETGAGPTFPLRLEGKDSRTWTYEIPVRGTRWHGLVVMSRQVVFDSADGRGSDRGVVPVMIVEVQPARECFAALSL